MTREEFEQLVMNTGPDIYSFCLQLARNREEAEELYQETMLAAMERTEKLIRYRIQRVTCWELQLDCGKIEGAG